MGSSRSYMARFGYDYDNPRDRREAVRQARQTARLSTNPNARRNARNFMRRKSMGGQGG